MVRKSSSLERFQSKCLQVSLIQFEKERREETLYDVYAADIERHEEREPLHDAVKNSFPRCNPRQRFHACHRKRADDPSLPSAQMRADKRTRPKRDIEQERKTRPASGRGRRRRRRRGTAVAPDAAAARLLCTAFDEQGEANRADLSAFLSAQRKYPTKKKEEE